jgi:excisionase family DNA binding protein
MTTTPPNPRPTTPPTPRLLLTVEQAAQALDIGRTTMFALIKTGEVHSVTVGRLRRVPHDEIQAYTDRLTTTQN